MFEEINITASPTDALNGKELRCCCKCSCHRHPTLVNDSPRGKKSEGFTLETYDNDDEIYLKNEPDRTFLAHETQKTTQPVAKVSDSIQFLNISKIVKNRTAQFEALFEAKNPAIRRYKRGKSIDHDRRLPVKAKKSSSEILNQVSHSIRETGKKVRNFPWNRNSLNANNGKPSGRIGRTVSEIWRSATNFQPIIPASIKDNRYSPSPNKTEIKTDETETQLYANIPVAKLSMETTISVLQKPTTEIGSQVSRKSSNKESLYTENTEDVAKESSTKKQRIVETIILKEGPKADDPKKFWMNSNLEEVTFIHEPPSIHSGSWASAPSSSTALEIHGLTVNLTPRPSTIPDDTSFLKELSAEDDETIFIRSSSTNKKEIKTGETQLYANIPVAKLSMETIFVQKPTTELESSVSRKSSNKESLYTENIEDAAKESSTKNHLTIETIILKKGPAEAPKNFADPKKKLASWRNSDSEDVTFIHESNSIYTESSTPSSTMALEIHALIPRRATIPDEVTFLQALSAEYDDIISVDTEAKILSVKKSKSLLNVTEEELKNFVQGLSPTEELDPLVISSGTGREEVNNGNRYGICHKCNKIIRPGVAVASFQRSNPTLWHGHCFTCTTCKQQLGLRDHYFFDGEPYCIQDYVLIAHIPKCKGCGQFIFESSYTSAAGHFWHHAHFVCSKCSRPLVDTKYILMHDKVYCFRCHQQDFTRVCKSCQKRILPHEAYVESGDYFWHSNETCLVCNTCNRSLVGKPFMFRKTGFLYCNRYCAAGRTL